MLLALTIVASTPEPPEGALRAAGEALAKAGARVKSAKPLSEGEAACGAMDAMVEAGEFAGARVAVAAALDGAAVDWCVQPWVGRRKRLLVADMDSTIIGCEGLDELADFAGRKAEVAAITERAMRGELEFEGALRERVAMLRGLSVEALERCRTERVRLNPGARTFVATMAAHGARTVLVSGGFTVFAEPVAAEAGFQSVQANRFVLEGDALAGRVEEPILGREAKLAALLAEAADWGGAAAALCIGDGANDLAMIEAADAGGGLGVAYRAKPLVAARAGCRIDHADLTAALYFQGYTAAEFAQEPGA